MNTDSEKQSTTKRDHEANALLSVKDLRVYYNLGKDKIVRAVEGLSFDICKGETLGIIGESGSGKSTVSRALIRLVGKPGYIAGGQLVWKGQNLLRLSDQQLIHLRGKEIGLIFQNPTTSLNPLITVGDQLLETVLIHLNLPLYEAKMRVQETLNLVGIFDGDSVYHKFPCDYSTGFRQRVMIAMAIVCRPDLVIADEPTTTLGVTVQAQIIDALRGLQQKLGMAIILITHDFGVVSELSDRILVMYAGYAMEYAPKHDFLLSPRHPYTLGLIESVPVTEARQSNRLQMIQGFPPDMTQLSTGCPFNPRCRFSQSLCQSEMPNWIAVADRHWCRCHFPLQSEHLAMSTADIFAKAGIGGIP